MEEKIRNDAENNTENKKKLTSHLDELVDSMTTKPGCGPVFSGLNVFPYYFLHHFLFSLPSPVILIYTAETSCLFHAPHHPAAV